MVLRLALLCHAPTAATRSASFPADEPLDGPGLARARAFSARIAKTAACLTSPALASLQTAEALNVAARIEPALRECDYGSWAGRSLDDVQAADPEGIALWLSDPSSCPHGGESMSSLLERVSVWLDGMEQRGYVVAITHASTIRAAVVAVLQAPARAVWRIDVSPLSITELRRGTGSWTIASVNRRPRGPAM